ncbi:acyl carrier protein [Streptomyces sp. M10(2022)]
MAGPYRRRGGRHPRQLLRARGHSLLGIKLLARLRDTLHVQVALQSLFDNLTVAELAAVVAAQLPHGQTQQHQSQQDGRRT